MMDPPTLGRALSNQGFAVAVSLSALGFGAPVLNNT